jgi:ethanolamine utilization protein EutQ
VSLVVDAFPGEPSIVFSTPGLLRCCLMPTLISSPTRIESAGSKPKIIDEYIGRVNTAHTAISVAHMRSPEGWEEPGQTPEFDEYTLVLRGTLRVQHKGGELDVAAGQAVIANRGEWIRYSTPFAEGAEYVALCLPAFSPDTVHRDK